MGPECGGRPSKEQVEWEKMAKVGAWRTDELTHMRPERLGRLTGVSESERLTFKVCVDKGRVWPWM